ncbi:MAG TPA: hypothetical protein VIQ28_03460 [Burkholderiales bacterium]
MRQYSLNASRYVARFLCAAIAIACASAASAADVAATPDDYLDKLQQLQPGDRLLLAPGNYTDGLPLHQLHGKDKTPIVIESADPAQPAVLLGRAGRNTVSLRDASYLVVRGLKLDGQNVPVDAVKAEHGHEVVHHIVLEGLTIVGHGEAQSIIGISTKAPAAFWTIRNNLIIGAGTGMYLGDSDGTAPFVAGIIEGNIILDSLGYNLQIKPQKMRPLRAGLPESDQITVIRANVFSKANHASDGTWARPNLLLGHLPPAGTGSEDKYLIEGNVFYANPYEPLFYAEGNVEFVRNLLVNPLGSAVAIQRYRGSPRRIQVTENFIVAKEDPLTLRDLQEGFIPAVAGNQMLATDIDAATQLQKWAEGSGALALQLAVSVCVQPTVAKALTVGDDDDGLCKRIRRVQEPKVQRQAKQ